MRFLSKVRNFQFLAVALIVSFAMGLASFCHAQTAVPIPIEVPDFDYASVLTGIMAKLAIPLAAAIGLGLSLMIITLIYRKIKSFAR